MRIMRYYEFSNSIGTCGYVAKDFNTAINLAVLDGFDPNQTFTVDVIHAQVWMFSQRFWDVLTTFVTDGNNVYGPMVRFAKALKLIVSSSHTQHQWTDLGARLCRIFTLYNFDLSVAHWEDAGNELKLENIIS